MIERDRLVLSLPLSFLSVVAPIALYLVHCRWGDKNKSA